MLVNMVDSVDDLDIEGDVLPAKRSREDGDTSGGESDTEVVPQKRRGRGTYHRPRPPRKNNPPAFIQLSLALQSELKKLQQLNGTK